MSCSSSVVMMHEVRCFFCNADKNTTNYCCVYFYMCANLMEFCVFIFFEKKITEAFVFVYPQHFVNKKEHLFLLIRNILLAFVLALQFIAIRANRTYIICKTSLATLESHQYLTKLVGMLVFRYKVITRTAVVV